MTSGHKKNSIVLLPDSPSPRQPKPLPEEEPMSTKRIFVSRTPRCSSESIHAEERRTEIAADLARQRTTSIESRAPSPPSVR
jgi:hypothetical protein